MSEQNPTEKASLTPSGREAAAEIVVTPRCPHCGRALPGINILSMELPTPRGGMIWFLPSCPFVAQGEKDGEPIAVDGGKPCGKIISAQFSGQYTQNKIAAPGQPGWLG